MKILVLGWYYSSNLGDAVLTDCTAQLLRQKYPHAHVEVRDLIGREGFVRGGNAALRGKLFRLLAKLDRNGSYVNHRKADLDRVAAKDWDMAVFAGGQVFMDSLAIYVSYLTEEFAKRQIPVFFQGCGMGPSYHAPIRRRLAQALNLPNVKYLSCRDDVARLHRLCGNDGAVFAADSALWSGEVFAVSPKNGSKTIGLGIMDPGSLPTRRVMKFWTSLIRELDGRGMDWKLFTNGAEADMAFARRLLETMPEFSPAQRLCPPPQSPKELVERIATFDSLISFRLHSHIIAAALGIPTVAMVWDEKLPFFFRSIGHPERCLAVDSSPEMVLSALAQAKESPCDRELLRSLREDSIRQLFDAMDAVYVPFLFRQERNRKKPT